MDTCILFSGTGPTLLVLDDVDGVQLVGVFASMFKNKNKSLVSQDWSPEERQRGLFHI